MNNLTDKERKTEKRTNKLGTITFFVLFAPPKQTSDYTNYEHLNNKNSA